MITLTNSTKSPKVLLHEVSEFRTQHLQNSRTDLPKDKLRNIETILSDGDLTKLLPLLSNLEYRKNISYENLELLEATFKRISETLRKEKNDLDVEIFFKEGYQVDIEELKERFKLKKLYKDYPNFNFKKLADLYKNPPKELQVSHSDEKILVDDYSFRKIVISIIQMFFNHMDLVSVYFGSEGAGKSTKVTQDMYIFYYILKELNVITYEFKVEDCLFNTLSKFREAEDKYFGEPFRLLGLDEGNELNKQDWKEDEVRTFFQRLRRERFNRRIKFISLPQLGELLTNIVLARVSFIYEIYTKNMVKSGMLKKGYWKLYIIPRGEKIYSVVHKKELGKQEIVTKLYNILKDKSYLTGMPQDIVIKKGRFNEVWGFNEQEYIKQLKQSNETFTVSKGVNFGELELFYFYKANITLKKIGIKSKDPKYHSLAKMLNRVNNYFEKQPDLLQKYEAVLNRKLEEKDANSD